MPFCRNCGTEHPEDANFCRNCGENLSSNEIDDEIEDNDTKITATISENENNVMLETIGELVYFIYPVIFFFLLLTQSFITITYSKDKGYDKAYNAVNYLLSEDELHEMGIEKNRTLNFVSSYKIKDYINDKNDDRYSYVIIIIYSIGVIWASIVAICAFSDIYHRIKNRYKNKAPNHLMLGISIFLVAISIILNILDISKVAEIKTTALPYYLLFISIICDIICTKILPNYTHQ